MMTIQNAYSTTNSTYPTHPKKVPNQQPPPLESKNIMIRKYSLTTKPENAIYFYRDTLLNSTISWHSYPNAFTFTFLFKACSKLSAIQEAQQLHAQMLKFGSDSDSFVLNSLLHLYMVCQCINSALQLFDKMPQRDQVSFNTVIIGLAKKGYVDEAHRLFDRMPEKSALAWSSLMAAYLDSGAHLDGVRKLFDKIPHRERDLISCNRMLAALVKNGEIESARRIFDEMWAKDTISWNSMIAGYVRAGCGAEAIRLLHLMQTAKAKMTNFTIRAALSACAQMGALAQGEWLHAYSDRNGIELDAVLGTTLLDMYSKCGSIGQAIQVFSKLPKDDVATWNAIISGLGNHGYEKQALGFFSNMLKNRISPNWVTFIGILTACRHSGNVGEGRRCFDIMSRVHGIEPGMKHYGCMVDLLGRAGLVRESWELISSMPYEPDAAIWGTVLGACRKVGDVETAEKAARRLVGLKPRKCGYYVLLSNIYACDGRWEEVEEVRRLMRERQIRKEPGCSWIEVNGMVHEFLAGDVAHPQSEDINSILSQMEQQLKVAGYVMYSKDVFFNSEW